jgi:hypothetical protein
MDVIALSAVDLVIMVALDRNLRRVPNPSEAVGLSVACKMLLLVAPPTRAKASIMANSKLLEMI